MDMYAWIYIFIGGAFGALSRYGLTQGCDMLRDSQQARMGVIGTWLANILGCLLIGIVAGMLRSSQVSEFWQPLIKYGVMIGFLGAFTTFSSYMLITYDYGLRWQSIGYVLLHHGVGLLFLLIGLGMASFFFPVEAVK